MYLSSFGLIIYEHFTLWVVVAKLALQGFITWLRCSQREYSFVDCAIFGFHSEGEFLFKLFGVERFLDIAILDFVIA